MAWLRAKTCVLVLFGLITFGQAYPYSYAWAESRHVACGCNLSGRPCVHGCDLKKKPKVSPHAKHSHGVHSGHGHDHAAMGPVLPEEKAPPELAREGYATPFWVNPDCSQQKKREVLDFRGDPFCPQILAIFYPAHAVMLGREPAQEVPQRTSLPDPPPPKA